MAKTANKSESPDSTARLTRSATNKQKKAQRPLKRGVRTSLNNNESDSEDVASRSVPMSKKNSAKTTEGTPIERLTSEISELRKEAKQRLRDSRKWEKMYKDEKSEREMSDARLCKEEEKVKNLKEKLAGKRDAELQKKVDAGLKEERAKTTFYRNQMLEMAKRLELHSRDALGGDPPSWKICEICTLEYENVEGRVPRVLDCGHTICESCVVQLADYDRIIICPFDRISMQMRTKSPKCLKKNYAVLQM